MKIVIESTGGTTRKIIDSFDAVTASNDDTDEDSFFDELKTVKTNLSKHLDLTTDLARLDFCILTGWTRYILSELLIPYSSFSAKILKTKGHYERMKLYLSHDDIKKKMEKAAQELAAYSHGKGRKNFDKSEIFIKHAAKKLKKCDYNQALDLYNKGILSTPFPDDVDNIGHKDRLSKLLKERSNIYKLMKKRSEAWSDIKDSIKYCPADSKLIVEILESEKELWELINQETGGYIAEPADVTLESTNNNLKGAVRELSLAHSKEKGRMIIADETIKPDKVLIVQEPYVQLVAPSYRDSFCAHCSRSIKDRCFPCRGCVYLRFCSSECSEKAWKAYHSKECAYTAALIAVPTLNFALRGIFTAGVDNALSIYRRLSKKQTKIDFNKMKKFGDNFEDILTLCGYEDSRSDDFMFNLIGSSAFVAIFAQTIGLVTEDCLLDFSALIVKFLAISMINWINGRGSTIASDSEDPVEIGFFLYSTASLLNHSCDNNTGAHFIGSKIVLTSYQEIKQNEEITISYIGTMENKERRQELLVERYLFKCKCNICKIDSK